MAQTRAVIRGRIQETLGDTDPTAPIFNTFRYNELINRNIQILAGRAILVDSPAVAVTLIAGTYDYTLAAALVGETQSITGAFLNTEGQEIFPLAWHEFNSIYMQDTAQPMNSGVPRHYTMWESTGLPRIRVGPTPQSGGTLYLHQKTSVEILTNESSQAVFSEQLIRALECSVAADLYEMAAPEAVQRLGKSPSFAITLRNQCEAMLKSHNQRKMGLGLRQRAVLRRCGQSMWGR